LDEYSWASAVGRIRVLERSLLPKTVLLSLAESRDLSAVLAALRDTPYGPYLSGLENEEAFEEPLEKFLKDDFRYIEEMSPEPMLLVAFRGRYDFHNLKVLAKARLLGTRSAREALSILGNLDPQELQGKLPDMAEVRDDSKNVLEDLLDENRLQDQKRVALDREVAAIWATYREVQGSGLQRDEGRSWLEIDGFIDCAYYAWTGQIYRRLGYQGIWEFFQSEVDLVNLKMAVRGKRLGVSEPLYRRIVLPYGTIPREALADAYGKDLSDLTRLYARTSWAFLASQGVSLLERKESLTRWEKGCDNALIEVVRQFRTYPLGPEPAVGYMAGREVEVRNLRIILTGKQSLVSSQEISERLRDTYA